MTSKSSAVEEYLSQLPEDRRAAVSAIRDTINASIGPGYEEGMQYGMIGWYVPHSVYPAGYHCDPKQPLPFASVASKKRHVGIYLFCLYNDQEDAAAFAQRWKASGKKLDMGKSCVRVKRLEDVPLDVLAYAIEHMPAKKFVELYERGLAERGVKHPGKKGDGAAVVIEPKKKASTRASAKKAANKTGKKAGKKAARKATKKPGGASAGRAPGKKTSKASAKKASKRVVKKAGKKVGAKKTSKKTARVAKKTAEAGAKKVAKRTTRSATKKKSGKRRR